MENEGLPAAVRKQGEAADAAMKEITSGEVVDLIVDSPHGADAPTTPVQPVPGTDDGGWEHKYNVLQGINNNQVEAIKRLNDQIVLANNTVENLNSIIANMQNDPRRGNGGAQPGGGDEPFQGSPEQGKDLTKPLDADNFGGYGEEMVEMVQTVNALVKENRDLKAQLGNVSSTVHETRQTSFFGQMDSMVPNWRTINTEPGFINWLKQTDPFSGLLRHDVLQNHYNASDSEKCAYIFRTWANENNYSTDLPAAGAADNNAVIEPLTEQEVPELGAGPGDGGSLLPETQLITRAQYANYATMAAQGKLPEEDFAKISAHFQKLIKEGKV